jgi:DNA polymerase-3 subunit gamma/tau
MLTDQAFNALLKTLEEPPAHAIFILATTEIHKIPITIFSRCQRLDFHKVKSQKMFEGLKKIVEKEGIKIDDKSLKKIVSISEGSVRDALSYLDQISAFANGVEIKFELIEDILGYSKEEKIIEFLNILNSKDIKQILFFINDFIEEGKDLENFIKDVVRFVRKILMAKIGNGSEEFLEDEKTMVLANDFSFEQLLFLAELLNNILKNNRFSFLPQLMLEIELIKFVNNPNLQKEEKNENRSFSGKIVNEIKNVLKPSSIAREKKEVASTTTHRGGGKEKAQEEIIEEKIDEIVEVKNTGWSGFLEKLKARKIVLYMALQGCNFADENDMVNLEIHNSFYFNRLSEKNNRDFIEDVFRESFGDHKKLNIIKAEKKEGRKDLIKDALSVFGGELVE